MSQKRTHRRSDRPLFVAIGIAVVSLASFIVLEHVTSPVFEHVTYHYEHEQDRNGGKMPLLVSTSGSHLTISMIMRLSAFHPNTYMLMADDCLKGMRINGQILDTAKLSLCDFSVRKGMDLSPFIVTGKNKITFNVDDYGAKGGVDLSPSLIDPHILLTQSMLLLFVLSLTFIATRVVPRLRTSPIPWAFAGGTMLRLWYIMGTPPFSRGYDADGHIDYITYMLEHWKVPASADGWEFYHPPLYYALSAIWSRTLTFLHMSLGDIARDVQILSFVLSLITFGVIIWIGTMLFPAKTKRVPLMTFLGLLATFPSLVYLSSRINNDTLEQCLAFLALALLLRWWREPLAHTVRQWIVLSIVIGLAILTKTNGLLLIAIAFAALLFSEVRLKKKLSVAAILLVIVVLMTGWFFALRFYVQRDSALVQNAAELGDELRLKPRVDNFLKFPPVFTALHPFNDPWNDDSGRQLLIPTMFRSAFFGEFSYSSPLLSDTAISILCVSLASFVFLTIGIVRDIIKSSRPHFPLLLSILVLFAGMVAFRISSPYSTSEDFRYVVLLGLPLAAYAVDGVAALPKFLRTLGYVILWGVSALSALFFLAICVMA